jgi:hypothetical protein
MYEVGGVFLNSPEYNLIPADAWGRDLYPYEDSLLTTDTMAVLDKVYHKDSEQPGK